MVPERKMARGAASRVRAMIPLDLNWNSADEPGLPSKWKLLIRNGDFE
jgi:hypothetical protein